VESVSTSFDDDDVCARRLAASAMANNSTLVGSAPLEPMTLSTALPPAEPMMRSGEPAFSASTAAALDTAAARPARVGKRPRKAALKRRIKHEPDDEDEDEFDISDSEDDQTVS
jgi:hypothetical protein